LLLAGSAAAQVPGAVPLERPELSGAIAGRVCRDLDGNGECGGEEPGLPGVRVVLETGLFAVTDAQGRYHLAAVAARTPDPADPGRLLPGRHRVALDDRGLPAGSVVSPRRATVEVPMGGVVLRSFAVRSESRQAAPLSAAVKAEAPPAVVQPGGRGLRFPLTGRAEPQDAVTVNGAPAEVDPQGGYRAWVELKPGANDIAITATSPSGQVRLFSQRVDVVQRPGEGFLVLPREVLPTARMALPAARGEAAATGPTRVRIEGAPGTRISHPGGEVTVGGDGAAEIPLELRAGRNEVPLTVTPPGQPAREDRLDIAAEPRPLVVGLLDLEGSWERSTGGLRLRGRGAAHAEVRLGGWELSGQLELRDQDLSAYRAVGPGAVLLPRTPEHLERALDPELYATEWGDRSVTVDPNPAEGLLRLEARHESLGRLGFGTYRARMEDAEVGRFQREIFGPYADVAVPLGPVTVEASGFYTPGVVDPLRGVATAPGHDELEATGGSLYYLGQTGLARGSESVRVELRDGLTGVPLGERHLVRGRDYEIDWAAGRLLLARPLSFVEGAPLLRSDALTASPRQVLVVDYERLLLAGTPRMTGGGEAGLSVGPVRLSAGAVRERSGDAVYQLYRARAGVTLGPLALQAEAARSQGQAVDPQAFGVSNDGGLTYLRPGPITAPSSGQALSVRLRGPGLSPEGHVDAAFRWRSAGFSDRTHADRALLRQLALRAEQPIGPVVVGLLADQRLAPDPREPFSERTLSARTLGASLGYSGESLDVRAEAKDAELTAAATPGSDEARTGARTSVGLSARYRLLPWLALAAGHKQVLAVRGEGLGAVNDTFSQGGVDVSFPDGSGVGVRAGYGPALGPLAWVQGNLQRGDDAYYGAYSVDVDGPDFGTARAVSGARTKLGDASAVFVEDVAAHDANSVRLSRAVGFSGELLPGLQLSARYERGTRHPLDVPSPLRRDAGGLTASYVSERLRLFARAELRRERGQTVVGPVGDVDRTQQVYSGGAELDVLDGLRFSGRLNFSDTVNAGLREAGFLEGTASLAYRAEWGLAVLRYSHLRETRPSAGPGGFGERTLRTLSLLPSVTFGSRLAVAAGAHAGWSTEAGSTGLVVSASLRPSVRIVGGLEVAGEVARRSAAPDGGELTALRGEAGYRFDDRFLVALGYTVFGFSGLGVSASDTGTSERVYLRAELAY
jgi:hypothetical protein